MKSAYIYDLTAPYIHSIWLRRVAVKYIKVLVPLSRKYRAPHTHIHTHTLLHETSLVQGDQRFVAVRLLLGFDKCNAKSGYEFQIAKKEMTW